MTNEQTNTEPPPPHAETDWFLQSLVNMVNGSSLEFGITLQVSGLLVSGSLVSGKQYFEGFAEDFSGPFAAADPEVAQSIKDSFSSYGELYSPTSNENDPTPRPQFIHLKNARFFNTVGKPIPGNKGVWWRGRLSEVAGFTLGSLSAGES